MKTQSSPHLSTSSSCWWAALPLVRATPRLLGHGPARHPICKPSITIVWVRRRHTPTSLVRAALSMNSTAPLFFGYRPTRLPIREAILAIVGICWCWRLRWLATNVVDPAAPLLLSSVPSKILPHSAIVRINRSSWGRWRHEDWSLHHRWGWRRPRKRPRRGPRRRRRGGRSGWRRGKWSWWLCNDRCWQRCGGHSRGRTTPAHSGTAIVFLSLGPHILDQLSIAHSIAKACVPKACLAIIRQRSGQAR